MEFWPESKKEEYRLVPRKIPTRMAQRSALLETLHSLVLYYLS